MYQRTIQNNESEAHFEKPQNCFTTKMVQCESVGASSPTLQPLMDTSFEQNLSEEHLQSIWDASIQYLRDSLKVDFDEKKGFNDANIFESHMEIKDSIGEELDPLELLGKNTILTYEKKKELVALLGKYKHLMKLMEGLYHLYSEQIFEQITMIVYESVTSYETFKQSLKLSKEFSQFLGPSYTELDLETIKTKTIKDHYLFVTEPQLKSKAEEIGDEIAATYFISTKIRCLNIKEISVALNKSNTVRSAFAKFIQAITLGVFLCCQGCFINPNEPNESNQELNMTEKTSESYDCQPSLGRKRRNE